MSHPELHKQASNLKGVQTDVWSRGQRNEGSRPRWQSDSASCFMSWQNSFSFLRSVQSSCLIRRLSRREKNNCSCAVSVADRFDCAVKGVCILVHNTHWQKSRSSFVHSDSYVPSFVPTKDVTKARPVEYPVKRTLFFWLYTVKCLFNTLPSTF